MEFPVGTGQPHGSSALGSRTLFAASSTVSPTSTHTSSCSRRSSRLAVPRWFSRSTSVFPSPASPTRSPSQRLPTPRPRRLCLSFTSTLAVTSTACSLRPSRGAGLLLHPFFRPSRGKGDGFLLALNLVGLRPFIHPPVATLTLQQSTEIWHTKTRIKTR